MSTITNQVPGTICWADLGTTDIEGARSFYGELLGWSISGDETPLGTYYIAKVGDRDAAGMMALSPDQRAMGIPPVWTTFIYVERLEDTIAVAEAEGGEVLQPPFDIPDNARIAMLADPTGASFALFEGPPEQGLEVFGESGALCWAEVLSRDPARAEAFYGAVFGWKAETSESGGTRYTMFKLDGRDVAGLMAMPAEVPAEAPSHWMTYFAVDDAEATCAKAAQAGGKVLRPATEIGIGRFAVLEDPAGAVFSVFESSAQD